MPLIKKTSKTKEELAKNRVDDYISSSNDHINISLAAFPESQSPRGMEASIIFVSIDDIEDHPQNVIIYGNINSSDIDDSIANSGIHQPLVLCAGVTKLYRCLAGHRRKFSCQKTEVLEAYKDNHDGESLKIPATYKGELNDTEQMRILLDTNQIRQKTFFIRVQESIKEKEVLSSEIAERVLLGKKVENKIIVNEEIGKKYFGVGRNTYETILKIYDILKDKDGHPILKQLNEASNSGMKIEWAKIYTNLADKPDKKRLGAGKSHTETLDFFPRLQDINFDLSKINNIEEAERAYLYFSKMARESKALVKKLSPSP